MPDSRHLSHHPGAPVEDRFLGWVDELVDPANGVPPAPDADFRDIARTANAVQWAAGSAGAPSLSTDRADAIWEDIMTTATVTPNATPALPARGNAPPIRPSRLVVIPSPGWRSYLATALLIAAIVVAGLVTIWRFNGPFGEGDGNMANQPGIAGSATSEQTPPIRLGAQELTPLDASPATPVTEKIACDVTGDIPIATGLDELPWSDTALLLNDGTLSLHCDGDSTVIAEGVVEAQSATWPGAVLLKMKDESLRGINIMTGATGDLGPASLLQSATVGPRSRWLGFPANEQQTDWRFVDLETMESLLLSEELGGVLPRPTVAQPYAWTPGAVVLGFPGSPVDVRAPSANPLDRGEATPPSGTPVGVLPSETAALVIDGSLDNLRWVETSRPSFVTAAISPDGELLAITQTADTGMTIRIERLSTGEMVAETGIDYGGGDSMVVLNDGAGLLHRAEDRIDLITWNGQGEVAVETLIEFEVPQNVPVLELTTDPNVAIAGVTVPDGGSIGYLIHAASGEITELPGMLQMPFANLQFMDGVPNQHVLAAAPHGADETQAIFRLIDATTGEAIIESDPINLSATKAANLPAALQGTGSTGLVFLADGGTVVLDAEARKTYTLPPPEPGSEGQWFYFPSPGGDHLIIASRSGGSIFVCEMASHGEWIEVSTDSRLSFVPGARALPEPD